MEEGMAKLKYIPVIQTINVYTRSYRILSAFPKIFRARIHSYNSTRNWLEKIFLKELTSGLNP